MALLDFQILKIVLFQDIYYALSRIQSFQALYYIDLSILDDQFDGQKPLVPYG